MNCNDIFAAYFMTTARINYVLLYETNVVNVILPVKVDDQRP